RQLTTNPPGGAAFPRNAPCPCSKPSRSASHGSWAWPTPTTASTLPGLLGLEHSHLACKLKHDHQAALLFVGTGHAREGSPAEGAGPVRGHGPLLPQPAGCLVCSA